MNDVQAFHVEKFRAGAPSNVKFLDRLPETPSFRKLDVLDVGSGWGDLCILIAQSGAKSVVGLDLKEELVLFSREYTRQHYPECPVEFFAEDLNDFQPWRKYDVIVSKDTFEHLMDIPGMLAAMRQRLKPHGRLFVGYSPLYHAPYGDHDRRRVIFQPLRILGSVLSIAPWGHLLLHRYMIWMYNRSHPRKISSLRDLGLNMVRFDQFMKYFADSGLRIVSLDTNVSDNIVVKIMQLLRAVPLLRNVCTQSVYCVLENDAEPT